MALIRSSGVTDFCALTASVFGAETDEIPVPGEASIASMGCEDIIDASIDFPLADDDFLKIPHYRLYQF